MSFAVPIRVITFLACAMHLLFPVEAQASPPARQAERDLTIEALKAKALSVWPDSAVSVALDGIATLAARRRMRKDQPLPLETAWLTTRLGPVLVASTGSLVLVVPPNGRPHWHVVKDALAGGDVDDETVGRRFDSTLALSRGRRNERVSVRVWPMSAPGARVKLAARTERWPAAPLLDRGAPDAITVALVLPIGDFNGQQLGALVVTKDAVRCTDLTCTTYDDDAIGEGGGEPLDGLPRGSDKAALPYQADGAEDVDGDGWDDVLLYYGRGEPEETPRYHGIAMGGPPGGERNVAGYRVGMLRLLDHDLAILRGRRRGESAHRCGTLFRPPINAWRYALEAGPGPGLDTAELRTAVKGWLARVTPEVDGERCEAHLEVVACLQKPNAPVSALATCLEGW